MKRFLVQLTLAGLPRLVSKPVPFTAQGYQVCWRGYIANTAELVFEAQQRGERLERPSDGELFALAYGWWGADLPRRVLGEYAVVIYDGAQGMLLLTHDELGLVPLFYSEMQDSLLAGSHLNDIIIETGIGELDEEYIIDYLAECWHLGKRTPYEHIRRVLPGQSILWKNGRLTERKTWTLGEILPLRYRDHRDYEEHLRPADGKVCCELSGGLDSSTVLACAVRSGGKNTAAFSFIYGQSHTADERKWINTMLNAYPVPWHSIDADTVLPFTEMPTDFYGEPNVLLLNAARQRAYYEFLKAQNIKVVLTGNGGDATFVGDVPDPYYLADLLRRFRLGELWTEINSWSLSSEKKRPPMYWLARFVLRPSWRRLRRQYIDYELTGIPWIAERYSKRVAWAQRGSSTRALRSAAIGDTWFFERILRSAHSVSVSYAEKELPCAFRQPLLHRPLVTYMCSVPWDIKLHPTCDRLLQRRAFESVLPDQIIRRGSKLGPDQTFYSGLEANAEWCERLTRNPRIVQRGYVLLNEWRHAVRQARVGRTVGIRFLLASASLEVWLQQLELSSSASGQRSAGNTLKADRHGPIASQLHPSARG
jgi:asparagine synthase (glutamine-hydrolysing)